MSHSSKIIRGVWACAAACLLMTNARPAQIESVSCVFEYPNAVPYDRNYLYGFNRAPNVITLPDGSLLASRFTGALEDDIHQLILGATSRDGGRKVGHDPVMALAPGADFWKTVGRLPRPVAMAAGARVGDIVYVADGLESSLSAEPFNTFFALDLRHLERGWRMSPSWLGPGRSQAVGAGSGDDFYLFSGLCHDNNAKGERALVYLKDAYCYRPYAGWTRLPDLPHAAAVSPAPVAGGMALVVSGADGSGAGRSPTEFYFAPRRIQGYTIGTSTWDDAGHAPVGRACISTVEWGNRWVLPPGEPSTGVRSPEVWSWLPKFGYC